MADAIYRNDRWQIERDPTCTGRSDLVRFVKRGPSGRKMLDQIAKWTGTGWDPSRWVPRPPLVRLDRLEYLGKPLAQEVAHA